jgi:cysteine desulfurase / selenocysteine lyase
MDATSVNIDIDKIREDFPILHTKSHGNPLIYLDNAATTQKPLAVINSIGNYYTNMNANIHRGVHYLSEIATSAFEDTRVKVQEFINAKYKQECIFVRGTTEAINLVASSFGRTMIKAGDEILISHMEHHSNIVPWQILCEQTGAKLIIIPVTQQGEIDLEQFPKLLTNKTKLLAIIHVSNALGTVNPIKQMIQTAHNKNIPVLVDGAQAAPHLKIDVQDLDCDFYTLSAHKVYGPTGVGILYGKQSLLEEMPPYQGGGDMILSVNFDKTTYNQVPHKFEAGTPNIAGVIAFGAAIDYLNSLNMEALQQHEQALLGYAEKKLTTIPGLKIIGQAKHKISVLSFTISGIHPHDIGTIADQFGIAIRTGHHCTMPLMDFYKVSSTARASFAFYNTFQEIDQLYTALLKAKQIFSR